jgi:1,4-alpha-glucan branching enzyme
MAGTGPEEFANLRALFGYMYGQAAKKLLFMGCEIGQRAEWSHESSLDWHLLEHESHLGLQKWVRDLNHVYRSEPALHELDCDSAGFEWVDCTDAEQSLISFIRRGRSTGDLILVACNFTPVPRHNYRIGVPRPGLWRELLNSDSKEYWGQGYGNFGGVESAPFGAHGHPHSVTVTLPPLGVVFFKSEIERATVEPTAVLAEAKGAPRRRPATRRLKATAKKVAAKKVAAKKARTAAKKKTPSRKKESPAGEPTS